jgi:hypothetical protein
MAKKKNKRPNLSQETLDRARAEMRGDRIAPVMADAAPGAVIAPKAKIATKRPGNLATRRIPTMEELRVEYSYVATDLRTLVILAGLLLIAIAAAAVLLPKPTV